MSTKTKFNKSTVIICFILTPFLSQPSQPLLPSPLKLQNFTTLKLTLRSVCSVCDNNFDINNSKHSFNFSNLP